MTDGFVQRVVAWLARSPAHAFVAIFVVAVAVRVWMLADLVPQRYMFPHSVAETEAIGISLATKGEFADPYLVPTGPTAHVPPVYPFILSLIYRAFGVTPTAGYVAWSLGILLYATMFAVLPLVSARLGLGIPVGLIGGLVGALAMIAWPDPAQASAGLAMALLMLAFLRRWTTAVDGVGWSLLLGVACAAALHLQPALLPVVLGWLAFEWWWRRSRTARLRTVLLAAALAVACVPWTWRNYHVLGALMFVRSNLGLELRVAYHEGATSALDVMDARGGILHPRTHVAEALEVRELGEAEYMHRAGAEARRWMRAHPRRVAALLGSRFLQFWLGPAHALQVAVWVTVLTLLAGIGAWRALPALAVPQRAVLFIPLATYPVVYYVVSYMSRYRIPLDWILLLLAAAAVWHAFAGVGYRGWPRLTRVGPLDEA